MRRIARRRPDSFTALLVLTGGVLTGLALLEAINAHDIAAALAASLRASPRQALRACLLLFSLGPAQPLLLLVWALYLGLLLWLAGRLSWEAGGRLARTGRALTALRDGRPVALPPALARRCADLGLAGRVDVVALAVPIAVCHGLFAPRILISTGLLERLRDAELEAVLLHERRHLIRRDPLRLLIVQSLAATFQTLPLVPMLRERAKAEQEVAADLAAVQAQGTACHLAAALLQLLPEAAGGPQSGGLALAGVSATAVRVEALTDPTALGRHLALTASVRRRSIAVLLVAVLAGAALTVAVHAGRTVHYCPDEGPMTAACPMSRPTLSARR